MADEVGYVYLPQPDKPVTLGENEVHEAWPPVSPSSPYLLVNEKFDTTMQYAEDMMNRLVGIDGNGGYLGELSDLINTYNVPSYDEISVNLTTSAITVDSRPAPDILENIDTNFGSFNEVAPTMESLPSIDTSGLTPGEVPADPVGADITWNEAALPTTVYDAILTRVLNDLTSGATGLDATVEQEIYDRTLARTLVSNDKLYAEIGEYFAAMGHELPPGAMAGRLAEAAAEITRNNEDINGKIMIEQAQLAQKNSQFVIQMSIELEKIIRATREGESNRALDSAKAVADIIIRKYAEKVRAYIAIEEAKKANIETQVAVLQGVIAHNKGLVDLYASQAAVFKTTVEAKAASNQGIIDGYKAEVIGYEAETKAISANQQAVIEDNKAKIAAADLELRQIIANIEASLKSYDTEMKLRERISADMAQIAAQTVASALNSVSANASLGYSGSESKQEGWSHSESIQESHSRSSNVNEVHYFTHDPTA